MGHRVNLFILNDLNVFKPFELRSFELTRVPSEAQLSPLTSGLAPNSSETLRQIILKTTTGISEKMVWWVVRQSAKKLPSRRWLLMTVVPVRGFPIQPGESLSKSSSCLDIAQWPPNAETLNPSPSRHPETRPSNSSEARTSCHLDSITTREKDNA
jgi:hypothetical protein